MIIFFCSYYKDIRYLLLIQHKPNESKKLLSNYYQYSWYFKTINLCIEGKIVVFKTLAISKLVFLALLAVIPNHITDEEAEIQNSFIWHDSSPKIKHETLRMEFKAGGLKMFI